MINTAYYSLGKLGWHALPWQACESYLNTKQRTNCYEIDSVTNLSISGKAISIRPINVRLNTCTTILKLASYALSFFILPAIAYGIRACYRSFYQNKMKVISPKGPKPSSPASSLDVPKKPAFGRPAEALRPPAAPSASVFSRPPASPAKPAVASTAASSFSSSSSSSFSPAKRANYLLSTEAARAIFAKIGNGIAVEGEVESMVTCAVNYDTYTDNDGKRPVFVLEDGSMLSQSAAVDYKARFPSLRKGLNNEPLTTWNYHSNIGLINQVKLTEDNQICWIEPISGAILGQEGFKTPYFCPADGHIYDLATFRKYVVDQQAEQIRCTGRYGPISSPVNPTITFTTIDLYPHVNAFSLVASLKGNEDVKQPKYEAVNIEVKTGASARPILRPIDSVKNAAKILRNSMHEPITGVKLGKPQFTQPYVFKADGKTYDLTTLERYIHENIDRQISENGTVGPIPCPSDPTITFTTAKLKLNVEAFRAVQQKHPEISDLDAVVRINVPIFND